MSRVWSVRLPCLIAIWLCGQSGVVWAALPLVETEAVSSNPAVGDGYGASVSITEDYLAVGANRAQTVQLFGREANGSLTYLQTINSPGGGGDDYGFDVSLSGNGNSLAVGALSESLAYTYTRSGSTWLPEETLSGPGGSRFGTGLSVDGDNLLVGAYVTSQVFAYHREGGVWTLESTITGSGNLGYGVGLSGDLGIAGSFTANSNAGSANIFRRTDVGGGVFEWVEEATLTASDTAPDSSFGQKTDIFAGGVHGEVAIVGAQRDDAEGDNAGAAYIFRNSGGSWVEQAKLTASDASADAMFGFDVAIWENTAIVGAAFASGEDTETGAAYIYQWDGVTFDEGKEVWDQIGMLTASDGAAEERFGIGVDVFRDSFAVGAQGVAGNIGSAYVFTPVPEPGTASLLMISGLLIAGCARKRSRWFQG